MNQTGYKRQDDYMKRINANIKELNGQDQIFSEIAGITEEWDQYLSAQNSYLASGNNDAHKYDPNLYKAWKEASRKFGEKKYDLYKHELCEVLNIDPQTSPEDRLEILIASPFSSNYLASYRGPGQSLGDKFTSLDEYMRDNPSAIESFFSYLGLGPYELRCDVTLKYFFTEPFKRYVVQSMHLEPNTDWETILNELQKPEIFCNKLIEFYLANESADAYDKRRNNEEQNMKRVLSIVNSSHPVQGLKGKVVPLLIAARNLTLTGGRDFYSELITHPAMKKELDSLRQSATLAEYLKPDQAQREGSCETRRHPLTHCEEAHDVANQLIAQHSISVSNLETTLNKAVKPGQAITASQNAMHLLSAVARTMGKTPVVKQNKNGTYSFSVYNSLSLDR